MFVWKNVAIPEADRKTFERRAEKRIRVGLKITVGRVAQGKFCRFLTQDMSSGGLRFLSSVPIMVGEVLDIAIPVDEQGNVINVMGKVTWSRGTPESPLGVYEGGVVFTRISARSHERLNQFIVDLETRLLPQAEPAQPHFG